MTDEDSLRAVIFDDVDIGTFNESALDGTFLVNPFQLISRKLICFPSALRRLAVQEACKSSVVCA